MAHGNVIGSRSDSAGTKATANRSALVELMVEVRAEEVRIREGGGPKAADAQRAKGRLTVRERIALLIDPVAQTQVSEADLGHLRPGGKPLG